MAKSGVKDIIQHKGTVIKVETGSVLVSITSEAACSGCHAESICNLAGREEKIIDVKGNYSVSPGDKVVVLLKQAAGYKAVIISYLIPVLLLIGTLILFGNLPVNEIISGLGSILLLALYFLLLYFFRKKINSSFTFTLKT
jgi:positive regulator of sigma E activity